ncbi:MAG TPA: RodZ domain-containing protein [Gaiellaceae bacterium]|jgi:cytoskeleton protein RodZ|nr:RodZ domain-containing protein [Gaiellaceae bacterium]
MFEIGGSLREARLKRELTPADVQKAIRIRDRYLQALEEERWDVLPGDAYVKGFLRTYADYLGLDGNLYVDEYNSRFARPDEPTLVPERFARTSAPFAGVGFLRPLVAIGVIVAIVGGLAAWQLSRSGSNQGTPPTTSSLTPTTTASHHHTRPKKTHRTHVSTPLPGRAVLVAARGDCWLEVRSDSVGGKLVYENTLRQGQKLNVDLRTGQVWIDIGAPTELDIHLGGKLVHGLPTQAGTVVLTRRGLKS